MYRIKDAKYGAIIEEGISFTWVKQQKRVDLPIVADSLEEADGVVLSDGDTMLGIEGRNMQNYTPLVTIEEVSSDPLIFRKMDEIQLQVDEIYAYQTSETVLKNDLDEAYKAGVNAV